MKPERGIIVWAKILAPVILYMGAHMLLSQGLKVCVPAETSGAWASVLLLPVTALWYFRQDKPRKKRFGAAAALEALGAACCFALLAAGKTEEALEHIPIVWAAVVLAGPLTEEMLYRGGVYAQSRQHAGILVSAVLSGLLFGAAHPAGVLTASAAGALFCLLMERGGLGAAILAHVLVNLLSFWPGWPELPVTARGLGAAGLALLGIWLLACVYHESKNAQG